MRSLKMQIKATMALGVLSLLATLIAHLALTDIYHREADASLEWSVLRVCALVFIVFVGTTIATLKRALRALG